MSALSRSKTRAALAAAAIGAVVIVAFVVAYPAPVPQATTSSALSSTNSTLSTIVIPLITSSGTRSTTLFGSSSSSTASSQTSTATTTSPSSTTSSATRSTTSRTFNSTNVITIPYGVGDNESLNFQPSSTTVVVGVNNTIVWNDLDAEQHTVTSMSVPSGAAKFDSGILNQGQTFTLTLTVPGTYEFYCTIHPTWMRGTIVVKP